MNGNDGGGLLAPLGEGYGYQDPFVVPAPAAGQPATYTPDAEFVERIVSIRGIYTTSAVAGTRAIVAQFKDGNGNIVHESVIGAGLGPTTACKFCFSIANFSSNVASGTQMSGPLPNIFLGPQWTFSILAYGGDVADTITAIAGVRERFVTGPRG